MTDITHRFPSRNCHSQSHAVAVVPAISWCSGFSLVNDFGDDLNLWNAYQATSSTSNTLCIAAGTHDARGPDATGTRGSLSKHAPGIQTVIGQDKDTTFVDQLTVPFVKDPYRALNFENGPLPRIDTMLTGETVATLKVLADVSKFVIGRWVQLLAYDMQAFGYPQNNHFFEFRQIIDVDVGTGEITLDQGVRHDYKDTYPAYNSGSFFFPDQCGAATLMPMTAVWDTETHVKNLSINPVSTDPVFAEQRKFTWENCHFLHYGHIPSISHEAHYLDCEFDAFVGYEFDKSVDLANYERCIINDVITQQSSSVHELTMTDCEVNALLGVPKYCTLTNSSFASLLLGTFAYGGAYAATITGCSADAFGGANRTFALSPFISTVGGVWTVLFDDANDPNNNILIRLIPDLNLWYHFGSNDGAISQAFQCTDVTYDSGTEIITYTTTLTGSEPEMAIADRVRVHSCPILNVSNSTGSLAFCSWPAAADMALGEYAASGPWAATATYVAYDGVCRFTDMALPEANIMFGEVVSLTVTVTKAYTGTRPTLTWEPFYFGAIMVLTDGVTVNRTWDPKFNVKTTGTRVITPAGVTGGVAGDSGAAMGTHIFFASANSINVRLSHDISGEDPSVWPEFEYELILDQGIP